MKRYIVVLVLFTVPIFSCGSGMNDAMDKMKSKDAESTATATNSPISTASLTASSSVSPTATESPIPTATATATYSAPTLKSVMWPTTDPWWASVFGDVSSIDSTRFAITETSTGVSMRSGYDLLPAGKIGSTDGIAFYFQKIPISKDFTLTAIATVTSITQNNNQVGFGLMIRDAVLIDVVDPTFLCNSVACGTLKGASGVSAWSSWSRETIGITSLTGTTVSSSSVVPVAGSVVIISISKVGSSYTCVYGSEASVMYDSYLGFIDSSYVYAGLFTSRYCQVEFSNISLVIK